MTRARLVPIGGFLGAGKTTTFVRAAQALQVRGEVVAVVTNDQGEDLVDTDTVRDSASMPTAEVTGGCFCCRFDELAGVVTGLLETHRPTVVLAEAVGSCTDLQSTVVRPLRALHGDAIDVAPLAVVVDPARYRALRGSFGSGGADTTDLAHLYHHQLAEADVLAVNKIDTLTAADRDEVCGELAQQFPSAQVIAYSAATGENVDALLAAWAGPPRDSHDAFAVDYDRYGAAEAELAWLNQAFDVRAADGAQFVADDWVAAFLADLGARVARDAALVGHVKVRVATAHGCAKASLVAAAATGATGPLAPVVPDERDPAPTDRATALVNARVGTTPQRLTDQVADAVQAADRRCASASVRLRGTAFRPGYPAPTHRF